MGCYPLAAEAELHAQAVRRVSSRSGLSNGWLSETTTGSSWPDCDIREYAGECAGKPTVAKSALRFSGCFTATSPKGSPGHERSPADGQWLMRSRQRGRLLPGVELPTAQPAALRPFCQFAKSRSRHPRLGDSLSNERFVKASRSIRRSAQSDRSSLAAERLHRCSGVPTAPPDRNHERALGGKTKPPRR